jgi:predicted regulator of Ras-like GTPase activity (Roadblock/LC7/MglB family)
VLASAPVDAGGALADLMEVSAQVEAAVVLDENGDVAHASTPDPESAQRLARAAREALAAAEPVRRGAAVTQLEATTRAGTLFVVRNAGRTLAATTGAAPSSGLVLHDLEKCLRSLDGDPA